ncbi:MAG: glycine cleavage system protein GcvH [Aureliella sp.]
MKAEELRYNPSHEWVGVSSENGQKIATIGITAFAIEQLTDLVYMALPKVGQKVTAGQEFGEVESVKAVSPLYSPVSGEVVAVHKELVDRLDTLSKDPYGDGWIMKVKLDDSASLDNLLSYQQYQAQCAK